MLNPDAKLSAKVLDNPDKAATREGFGTGVVEAGKADERVVVLTADLIESTNAHLFKQAFPERFIEIGVAEQNLATVASGMAAYGKIPFFTSFATFNPGRNWEQIRTTICINNVPAICGGFHAGVLTGPDGGTHQALEDLAMMRALPNMIVISSCDSVESHKATVAAAKVGKPVYLRCAREKTPVMTTAETPFEIGKVQLFWKGENPQATIFSTGPLTHNALLAAQALEKEGVNVLVVNVHTLKPLDPEIVTLAKQAGAVVTVEEHQVHGGLGGAIAELLAKEAPMPIEFIGVQDEFGQTGNAAELIEHYKMGASHITGAVKKVIGRKKS